jgi:wyosine [tRNA(Phe)-imidazoG37] synthetase (radical SAM superfamily)
MNIIYGPVASWRLGRSLGVDVICTSKKICSFNCVYCQLENTEKITRQRQSFIDLQDLKQELNNALRKTQPDVITLSGMGEPTLAENIDGVIETIRQESTLPIAILTNSTFLHEKEIQESLKKIDIIVAKLDAPNEQLFQQINRPAKGITFDQTLRGIEHMRRMFSGKFALQMMFIQANMHAAEDLARLAREIKPDEIQLNTPLRPCHVAPLSKNDMKKIEQHFSGLPTLSVYSSPRPMTDPLDKIDMLKRRRMES